MLYVSDSKVTGSGVAKLMQAMPKLWIYDRYHWLTPGSVP